MPIIPTVQYRPLMEATGGSSEYNTVLCDTVQNPLIIGSVLFGFWVKVSVRARPFDSQALVHSGRTCAS